MVGPQTTPTRRRVDDGTCPEAMGRSSDDGHSEIRHRNMESVGSQSSCIVKYMLEAGGQLD